MSCNKGGGLVVDNFLTKSDTALLTDGNIDASVPVIYYGMFLCYTDYYP